MCIFLHGILKKLSLDKFNRQEKKANFHLSNVNAHVYYKAIEDYEIKINLHAYECTINTNTHTK